MSLTVSPGLIEQAKRGEIDDAAFASCIATSLPYAWQVITGLVGELHASWCRPGREPGPAAG